MKKLILYSVLFLLIDSSYSQSNWKWVSPYPPNKRVYSSVAIDGKAYLWCEDNCVIKLDILSERFEILPIYARFSNTVLGDFTEQGIAFADSLTGYLTDLSKGEFRTTNGGKNWVIKASTGSNIHLVTFGSKKRGWKLGMGGLYITNNAGESWSLLPIGPLFEGPGFLKKIFALNENQIWVLRDFHYQGNEGSIYYSSNAGYSWKKINTGLISNFSHQVRYNDFKMLPSGVGFAIGSITKPDSNLVIGFIQKTTDMGNTWVTQEFREDIYKKIISLSDNEWIIFGNYKGDYSYSQNYIIQRKTTDAGVSWNYSEPISYPNYFNYFYNALYTAENHTIYVFTLNGFFKSSDGGESYQKITSETNLYLTNIAFDSKPSNDDNQLGLAYMQWGKDYLITTDCGYSWQQKSLPSEYNYIWKVGIAEDVIYMIVGQDKIVKSTDFGETWIRLFPPIYQSGFQALSVYSKDVFSFSAYKNLVSSTDGGNSWIFGPFLSDMIFSSTDIVNPGNIFGVGIYFTGNSEKGFLFNTTNYGLSWHVIDYERKLEKIQMLNEKIGYSLSGNQLLQTSDSGRTWKSVLQTQGEWLFTNFIFSSPLYGIVNEFDKFYSTTNGGSTWRTSYFIVPIHSLSDMAFNAKGDLFIIGKGAMVLIPSGSTPNSGSKENDKDFYDSDFSLFQNYPNPFNPVTKIKFEIPASTLNPFSKGEGTLVQLKVYDILGNEVATLVDEYKPAGIYEVEFNASNLSSGTYFYRLTAGEFTQTKKMLLLQ